MNKSDSDLAQRIDKDHEELLIALSRLETYFEAEIEPEGFVGWKLDLLGRLRDFENQLQKHFDLEEDGGYNADLIRIAPHLAPGIARLEEDHRKIISDLDHVLDNVKRIESVYSPVISRIKVRIDALLAFIRAHESEEDAIIQEAYYQDYGVGD